MPIDEAVKTQAPARRFATPKDIEEFVSVLEAFERGVIGPDEFRTFRLTRGIYGQRQDDVQMIRVKIPQGILNADQLRALGSVARRYSRGFGHVTTRQNVQLHFVKMEVVPKAMEALEAVGLTTREACGNTVRNITACPTAGVCADEPFDVTPYGEALTRFFLRNPICQALPRKFKIALSGCPTDCAMGAMHDIGIIARTREVDGRREIGFKVVIGGGLSVSPQNAWVLHEFLPPERLLPVCEAIVRVFDRTGNRKNKGQARMKYAIRKLGFETFKAEIDKELLGLSATRDPEAGRYVENARPPRPEAAPDLHARIARSGAPAFRAWAATNTRPQRQRGYSMAFVTLPRGDVTAEQFEAIASIAETHGNGTVRTAQDQNMLLRWVKSEELPAVHRALQAIGLGQGEAGRLFDPTSCPGAESCKIAVTGSRELALAVKSSLSAAAGNGRKELVEAASDLRIKISGCPNSCGQHHVAGIGFHGAARHVNGRAVPAYQMFLGGSVDGEGAHFGRRSAKIPARRVPEALTRMLALFRDERRPDETALTFFKRVDLDRVNTVLADLTTYSETDMREDDFKDLGSDLPFEMEVGEGECAT
jgi:sulfite reductase beta subunit-like hemoprotein